MTDDRMQARARVAGWLIGGPIPTGAALAEDPAALAAAIEALDGIDEWAPADPDGAADLLEGLVEDGLRALGEPARAAMIAQVTAREPGPRAAAALAPFLVRAPADPRVEALLAGTVVLGPADGAWAAEAAETLAGLIDELVLDPAAALEAEARLLDPLLAALDGLDAAPAGPAAAAEIRMGPAVGVGEGPEQEPPLARPIPVEVPPGLPPIGWPGPRPRRGAGWLVVGLIAAAALLGLFVLRGPSTPDPIAPRAMPIGARSLVPPWVGALLPADPAPIPPSAFRPGLMPIPAGTAWLGSPDDEPGRQPDEVRRPVTLTRPLWVARTEVTQGQWRALMGNAPAKFGLVAGGSDTHPVEQVSWYDAVSYANALSASEGVSECYAMHDCHGMPGDGGYTCRAVDFAGVHCLGYRLPTEAEWEYAARAGTTTATHAGPFALLGTRHAPVLDGIAWYSGNSGVERGGMACADWVGRPPGVDAIRCGTHPVASKVSNAWGLHDMLGNVWEWTTDGHGALDRAPAVDPVVPVASTGRVVTKGCGWFREARFCRAANRYRPKPGYHSSVIGIRVVRTMRADEAGADGGR